MNNGIYSVNIGNYDCAFDSQSEKGYTTEFPRKNVPEDRQELEKLLPDAVFADVYTFGKTFYDYSDRGILNADGYRAISFNQFTVVKDFSAFNYKLAYGRLPEDEDEVVIFDYMADNMVYFDLFDGIDSIEKLVGFRLSDKVSDFDMVISGIIASDYEDCDRESNGLLDSLYSDAHLSLLRGVFGGTEFEEKLKNMSVRVSFLCSVLEYSNGEENQDKFGSDFPVTNVVHLNDSDDLDVICEYPEAGAFSFYVSDTAIADLFGIAPNDVTSEFLENKLGLNLVLWYSETSYGSPWGLRFYTTERFSDPGMGIPVTGVFKNKEAGNRSVAYLLDTDGHVAVESHGEYVCEALLLSDSKLKNAAWFEKLILHDYTDAWWSDHPDINEKGYYVHTYYSLALVDADKYLDMIGELLEKYFWLLLAALGVALFAYAVSTVNKNKYTIGILKSLGVTDGTVVSIYSIQIVLVSLVSLILSIPLSYLMTLGVNTLFSNSINMRYDFYGFNAHTLLALLGYVVATVTVSLASVFVYLLIQSPVKLIYNRKE